jgi:hypothetical protein
LVDVKDYRGRAYYSPLNKSIVLDPDNKPDIVIHELGHWLEDNYVDVIAKSMKFYNRRTQGESLTEMATLFPTHGYRVGEVTRVDKFLHPYMGKEYVQNGKNTATELVSMGLEMMWREPLELAKKDPDYFDFIWHLLRGLDYD